VLSDAGSKAVSGDRRTADRGFAVDVEHDGEVQMIRPVRENRKQRDVS
jgi:hypothetical protein